MVGSFRESESVTIGQLIEKNSLFSVILARNAEIQKKEELIPVSGTGMTEDNGATESNAESFIIPTTSALKPMCEVEISPEKAEEIRKDQETVLNNLLNLRNYDTSRTTMGDVPVAIYSFAYGCVKPIRVLMFKMRFRCR